MSNNNKKRNKGKGRATNPEHLDSTDRQEVSNLEQSLEPECPNEQVPFQKVFLRLKINDSNHLNESSSVSCSSAISNPTNDKPKVMLRLPAHDFKNVKKIRRRVIQPDKSRSEGDNGDEVNKEDTRKNISERKLTY